MNILIYSLLMILYDYNLQTDFWTDILCSLIVSYITEEYNMYQYNSVSILQLSGLLFSDLRSGNFNQPGK